MDKEKDQQKALRLQMMGGQARELEQQLIEIEKKVAELKIIQESLDDLKDNKGSDLLVPFGSGVLLKGKLLDDQNVLVNVGSGIMVEKTISAAKKSLDEQIKVFESVRKRIEKDVVLLKQEISKAF